MKTILLTFRFCRKAHLNPRGGANAASDQRVCKSLRLPWIVVLVWAFVGLGQAGEAELTYSPPEQAGLSARHLKRVDAQLMKYVASNRVSGTVALIARHGQIAYLKAFGLRDVEANLPM